MNHFLDPIILRYLKMGPRRVSRLALDTGRSVALVRSRLHVLHAAGAVVRCGVFAYTWALPGDEEACSAISGPQARLGGPLITEEQRALRAETQAQFDRAILKRLEEGPCDIKEIATACGYSLSATRVRTLLLLKQGKLARIDTQARKNRVGPMLWSLPR